MEVKMRRRHYLTSISIVGILMVILGSLQTYVLVFKKLSGMNMVYFLFTIGFIEISLGIFSAVKAVKYYTSNKKNKKEIS